MDGRAHAVSVYYANSAQLVVNTEDQAVEWSREKIGGSQCAAHGIEGATGSRANPEMISASIGATFMLPRPGATVTASAIAQS